MRLGQIYLLEGRYGMSEILATDECVRCGKDNS